MPLGIPFGRYVLLERIARGGMAEIFLAKLLGEAGFERPCVIKRVLPDLAADRAFVGMFLDEARIAALLQHPGIAQVFDVGRIGTDHYLAMEYLAGEDLSEVLARARADRRVIPLDVAARVVAAAAEALDFAHGARGPDGAALGIVHRDVSPSNLLVTYQGAVKVLDFGIARAAERLTRTEVGTAKGKVAYMAPEQIRGESLDRRVDVWALGVCLHELLTGRRLFAQRGSVADTIAAILNEPVVPPSVLRPEVPPRLDRAVLRALSRDPAARHPTAEALRAELEEFLAERTYVPQAVQLSGWLRDLFGEQRAEARLRAGVGAPQEASSTSVLAQPAPLEGVTDVSMELAGAASREAPTSSARTPPRGRRPRNVRFAALGVLAGVLGASGLVLALGPGRSDGAAADQPPTPPSTPPATEAQAARYPTATATATQTATQTPTATATQTPTETATPTAPARPAPERPAPDRGRRSALRVEANVPVEVHLDGRLIGSAPAEAGRVAPGRHRVRLVNRALGLSRTDLVTVKRGARTVHEARFERGTLHVAVTPWADVWLDGVHLGQTPLAGRPVWEGEHSLRLVGPRGEKTVAVRVRPGATTVVREALP